MTASTKSTLPLMRQSGVPDIGNAENPVQYLNDISRGLKEQGVHITLREKSVDHVGGGVFSCCYTASILHDGKVLPFQDFTVFGLPTQTRSMAYCAALVEYVGLYTEMEKGYLVMNGVSGSVGNEQTAVVHPANGVMPDGAQLAGGTHDDRQDDDDGKRPEIPDMPDLPDFSDIPGLPQKAETISDLIDRQTVDNIPVLRDLYKVGGDANAVANQALAVLMASVEESQSLPALHALWANNEANIEFIADFEPKGHEEFKLALRERTAFHRAEEPVVEQRQPDPVVEPPKRKRGRPRKVEVEAA